MILQKIVKDVHYAKNRELIIPYIIRFGIKLYDDDSSNGSVFGSNCYFTTIKEAKDEAIEIYKTTVKKMFPDAECGELIMVSDLKCDCDCGCNIVDAKYEDGDKIIGLVGRMDGEFFGGEFYVEIIKG